MLNKSIVFAMFFVCSVVVMVRFKPNNNRRAIAEYVQYHQIEWKIENWADQAKREKSITRRSSKWIWQYVLAWHLNDAYNHTYDGKFIFFFAKYYRQFDTNIEHVSIYVFTTINLIRKIFQWKISVGDTVNKVIKIPGTLFSFIIADSSYLFRNYSMIFLFCSNFTTHLLSVNSFQV